MLSETKKAVTRAKALYGFFRIVKYARWWISSSVFLSSKEKEKMLRQVDELVNGLYDANQRSKGINPELPSVVKQEQKRKKERQKRVMER